MEKIKAGIAGSGAMGTGIAQVALLAGCSVVLLDTNDAALNNAQSNIIKSLNKLIEKGKIQEQQKEELLSRLQFTPRVSDFSGCQLVIEAVVENLETKKALFAAIENVVDDSCILATNTSSLSIVSVAAACKIRSRVIGIHFFNPATLMPLVEIIPALTTAENVLSEAVELIKGWGKTTVVAKDTPGFIVNRIARPFYGEAIKMYEEGIASIATIDNAMKQEGGFKMGPFELMDFIGNDINYKVTETVWEQLFYDPRYRPSLTQKRLFEAGMFGKKSGQGYYDYSTTAIRQEPELNKMKSHYIFERILFMLINEAADALYLRIATAEDIELAMTKGVNYPKGLLHWADEIGIERILNSLNQLQADYGEDRYRPSLLLKKMVAEQTAFFR
jgi:3-hydroxybutyryl-CoA dehydrogenase